MGERRSARQQAAAALRAVGSYDSVASPSSRGAGKPRTSPLSDLPLELIHQIISHLDPPSLLALSLTSSSLRRELLAPSALPLWRAAREAAGLTDELKSWSAAGVKGEIGLATLLWGTRCKSCGRGNARKLEVYLRVRLCTACRQSEIIAEGPDEPDPAFAHHFAGTKRYTLRAWMRVRRRRAQVAYFYGPSVDTTSAWLSSLFSPFLEDEAPIPPDIPDFEVMDEDELLDFLFLRPPPSLAAALNARESWMAQARSDGATILRWEEARKEREKEERKATKALGVDHTRARA